MMSIRKDENYNNRNKYSVQDVAELQAFKAEEAAVNAVLEAAQDAKKAIIVKGLMQKYGFSDVGAAQVMALIERGWNQFSGESCISGAKFCSIEKEQSAQRAFEYYWKN